MSSHCEVSRYLPTQGLSLLTCTTCSVLCGDRRLYACACNPSNLCFCVCVCVCVCVGMRDILCDSRSCNLQDDLRFVRDCVDCPDLSVARCDIHPWCAANRHDVHQRVSTLQGDDLRVTHAHIHTANIQRGKAPCCADTTVVRRWTCRRRKQETSALVCTCSHAWRRHDTHTQARARGSCM